MATYDVPYQNLKLSIPDEGQVFRGSGDVMNSTAYVRKNNKIYSVNFQDLGRQYLKSLGVSDETAGGGLLSNNPGDMAKLQAAGIGFGQSVNGNSIAELGRQSLSKQGYNLQNLPQYNIGDVNTAFGEQSKLSDLSWLNSTPTGQNETITKSISPINPQGADVTSNLYGSLSKSPSLEANLTAAGATPKQIQQLMPSYTANAAPGISPTGAKLPVSAPQFPSNLNDILGYPKAVSLNNPIPLNGLNSGPDSKQLDLNSLFGASSGLGVSPSTAGIMSLYDAHSATQDQYDALNKSLTDLMGSLGNKAADTQTALGQYGVPQAQQQLQGLNLQAAQLKGELDKFDVETEQAKSNIEGQQIPLGLVQGQQAALQKQRDLTKMAKSAELASVVGLAQAYQGNIDMATQLAHQAVDMKYQPILAQIDVVKTQIGIAGDKLDREDKKRTAIINTLLDYQKQKYTEESNNAKQIQSLAIQAASNGAPLAVVNSIKNATDPVAAASLSANYVKGNLESPTHPNAATPGGPAKPVFTQTQTNKGASNAGLAAPDFAKLDSTVQNFYVNNTTQSKWFSGALSGIQDGSQKAADVLDTINTSNLPDPVKNYLTQQVNAKAPAKSGGGNVLGDIWDSITGFFGNIGK